MNMTQAADVSYADQLEETIRRRGPISTAVLCQVLPHTPALVAQEAYLSQHPRTPDLSHMPMGQRWLTPYLRDLAHGGRIRWNGVFGWVACSPTMVEGLKDPVPSDERSDETAPEPGGPEG